MEATTRPTKTRARCLDIPEGLYDAAATIEDHSWINDASDMLMVRQKGSNRPLALWIADDDPADREMETMSRYCLVCFDVDASLSDDAAHEALYEHLSSWSEEPRWMIDTEDAAEVIEAVKNKHD